MNKQIKVGIIGSQFISHIHTLSLKRCAYAEAFAVASPTPGHAKAFAAKNGITHHFTDYQKMLEMPELDMVVLGVPNDLHCEITVNVAAAGKHIVVEKPLCLNLAEADRMIAACKKAKVKLMYAEELCFAPKYVRMKQLLDSGALGTPTLLKQSEKHSGPHAPHFWDVNRSGGASALTRTGTRSGSILAGSFSGRSVRLTWVCCRSTPVKKVRFRERTSSWAASNGACCGSPTLALSIPCGIHMAVGLPIVRRAVRISDSPRPRSADGRT